jgi:hypothetical protein
MKNYKYYSINDISKESIGVVSANDEEEAYSLASNRKNLRVESFKKIFKVEEL